MFLYEITYVFNKFTNKFENYLDNSAGIIRNIC